MAYTTIKKPTDYFNTKLYTGNGSTGHAITGVGHQPDFVWIKNRDATNRHTLHDVVRGVTKRIRTDGTEAEDTTDPLTSFDSDGFTLNSTGGGINGNTENYVSWNWKAGAGQGSSNTDGSINTTYTSVNTTAGFSISSYTGTGSNATVGHGLGVAPDFIIIKSRTESRSWVTGNSTSGWTKWLALESTDAESTASSIWNDTAPTSSVFSIGTSAALNGSGQNFVAYCFAEKKGYSKFGSYVGNGNADGTFVYTGFKPAWVMVKNANNSSADWTMFDVKRNTYNIMDKRLRANLNNAEDAPLGFIDFTSNGFKWRTDSFAVNGDGNNHVFMVFAEEPLVGDNPATAR